MSKPHKTMRDQLNQMKDVLHPKLRVKATFTAKDGTKLGQYVLDHNNDAERKTLGMRCRDAFEQGITVTTTPL